MGTTCGDIGRSRLCARRKTRLTSTGHTGRAAKPVFQQPVATSARRHLASQVRFSPIQKLRQERANSPNSTLIDQFGVSIATAGVANGGRDIMRMATAFPRGSLGNRAYRLIRKSGLAGRAFPRGLAPAGNTARNAIGRLYDTRTGRFVPNPGANSNRVDAIRRHQARLRRQIFGNDPPVRANPDLPGGIETFQMSHTYVSASSRLAAWLPDAVVNGRWNRKFMWQTQHALADPRAYQFMPATWKASNPLPGPAMRLWARMPIRHRIYAGVGISGGLGYGAYQLLGDD